MKIYSHRDERTLSLERPSFPLSINCFRILIDQRKRDKESFMYLEARIDTVDTAGAQPCKITSAPILTLLKDHTNKIIIGEILPDSLKCPLSQAKLAFERLELLMILGETTIPGFPSRFAYTAQANKIDFLPRASEMLPTHRCTNLVATLWGGNAGQHCNFSVHDEVRQLM
jgi:hypothetical protein